MSPLPRWLAPSVNMTVDVAIMKSLPQKRETRSSAVTPRPDSLPQKKATYIVKIKISSFPLEDASNIIATNSLDVGLQVWVHKPTQIRVEYHQS